MAYKKNPFKTIEILEKKMNKALEHLLKKVPEDDIVAGIKEIRLQRIEEAKKSKKRSFAYARIQNLLRDYPGFQKEILKTLNARVKEAKKLGVLYKYESEELTALRLKKESQKKLGDKPTTKAPVNLEDLPKKKTPLTENDEEFTSQTMEIDMGSLLPSLNKEDQE